MINGAEGGRSRGMKKLGASKSRHQNASGHLTPAVVRARLQCCMGADKEIAVELGSHCCFSAPQKMYDKSFN